MVMERVVITTKYFAVISNPQKEKNIEYDAYN